MRLFQRSCPKSGKPALVDESQKSFLKKKKGVFQLFSCAGSLLNKKKATPAEAIVVCLDDAASKKPPAADATDFVTDCTSGQYNFVNQNYTPPAVGLSPEPASQTPTVLPLRPPPPDGHDSVEAKETELTHFELWQRRRPHFHFGPRDPAAEQDSGVGGTGGQERKASASTATSASENVIALPPQYMYIYQDGKFVEREVTKWPKQPRALPHLRYRIMEPYASRYGKQCLTRINTQERIVSQRCRLIYNSPIFVLPRKMMEENKSRLMTRYSLKKCYEGPVVSTGPQKVDIGDSRQSKIAKMLVEKQHQKEAVKLVDYMGHKGKAEKAS